MSNTGMDCWKNNQDFLGGIAMTSDRVFKYCMAREQCARRLINSLPFFMERNTDIVSVSPGAELTGALKSRGAVLDVLAETTDGIMMDIEMQLNIHPNLVKRARFYLSQMQVNSTAQGEDWHDDEDDAAGEKPRRVKLFMSVFFVGGDYFKDGSWYNEIVPYRRGYRNDSMELVEVDDGEIMIFCNLDMPYEEIIRSGNPFWDAFARLMHDLQCKAAKKMCYTEFRETMESIKEDPNMMRSWEMDVADRANERMLRNIVKGNMENDPDITASVLAKYLLISEQDAAAIMESIRAEKTAVSRA